MCAEMVGWRIPSSRAAADMLPVRAVASKAFNSAEDEISIDWVYRLIAVDDSFINAHVMFGVDIKCMSLYCPTLSIHGVKLS